MRARQWRQGAIIGALALACFWLGYSIWSLAGKAEIAVRQAKQAESAYRDLEARKQQLAADLAAASTPRGEDAAIRTAFGVARPGEEVIVVVPPATSTATVPPPWWERLWSWF